MDDRTGWHQDSPDHWEIYAEAMELTIEGHRLIAQEIGYELKRLGRAVTRGMLNLGASVSRRHPSPP